MSVLYNENDPYAAQWLENLVDAGLIASGAVNRKSIVDLDGRELDGARQAHFFAGIGVWSTALRAAGWPDSRPVWTGSCPCQPFSAAGKGAGFADPRHLWPAWFRLIRQHRPRTVFGEQVEGPAGRAWLDLVFTDLEGCGYACGAVVFPAAGVGAPHLRHRTYWTARLADADDPRPQGWRQSGRKRAAQRATWPGGVAGRLADADQGQRRRFAGAEGRVPDRPAGGRAQGDGGAADDCGVSAWADIKWLPCRDGKWRPTQPGLFPLATGTASRVGKLRAYGNALCLPQAQAFIEAFLELEALNA